MSDNHTPDKVLASFEPKPLSVDPTQRPSRRIECLPAHIRDRYREILNDPDYLSSRENIASMELRVQELYALAHNEPEAMGGTGYNGVVTQVKKLRYKINKAMDAYLAGEDEAPGPEDTLNNVLCALRDLQDYCEDEKRKSELWAEIRQFEITMGKLKDTDTKRMVAANQCLTIPESYALCQALVTIIETYLEDKELRARAVREIWLLLNRKGSR